ncbi:MAG: UPF0489 family protein [Erysipelotrichaceae bacterium]|nr:UPF0489 family protein [Erysipelotrichaceae bacterium]
MGLSKNEKTKGRIVTHHNGAFYYWRELIENRNLTSPFNVVHVDAHADLGLGDAGVGWPDVFKKLLVFPPSKRIQIEYLPEIKRPSVGDYLIYAIACRWISSLTYVPHPTKDGDDILACILKYRPPKGNMSDGYSYFWERDDDEITVNIQLPYNQFDDLSDICDIDNPDKQASYIANSLLEPKVSFTVAQFDSIRYKRGFFDYVVFSQSPNFTPSSADYIMKLKKDYII